MKAAKKRERPSPNIVDIPDRKNGTSVSSEEKVYIAIYNAVMDHKLQPGTKLTESTFSQFFGVSRTIIRKALFRLAEKNIVELRPNRGAIVACPTVEETLDIFNTRQIIECATISAITKTITKEKLSQLKKHVESEEESQKQGDRHTIIRMLGDFHIVLANMQPNRVLAQYVTELVSRTTLIVALYEAPGASACSNHDHWELLKYIEARDEKNAIKAMREHLQENVDRLRLEEPTVSLNLNEIFANV